MKCELANKVEIVPENAKQWIAEEAQEWARKEVLAGGPPDKPRDEQTGKTFDWASLKNYVGKKVRIVAKPRGFILHKNDGTEEFVVEVTTGEHRKSSRFRLNDIDIVKIQKNDEKVKRTKKFVDEEIERYNKISCDKIRKTQKRTTTFEFWESGKRICTFLKKNRYITQNQLINTLKRWGTGKYGYGSTQFEFAIKFFKWKNNLQFGDPIFSLSETRIMNIIRATKNKKEMMDNLLVSCLNGSFKDLSDEQFKWVTGQSFGTFPQKNNTELFNKMSSYGINVMRGKELSKEEYNELINILNNLQPIA